jgi:hypothetical protein
MQSYAIKSFLTCALGVAVMAGCAAPASPPASASRANVQMGKVASVEAASAAGQPAMSSGAGGGAAGTAASSGPTILNVVFADGTQGRYSIEKPTKSFAVGEPIQVITDSNRITITSAPK